MALVLLADGVAEATAAAAPESVDSERLAMSDERAATVALLEGNTKIMSIVVGVCSSLSSHACYRSSPGRTPTAAPRVAHTRYRMQACVVHRSIKNVGREPN